MATRKESVMTSITRAKANLEQALSDMEHLPAFDPGALRFAAHALSNYLAVVQGTVQLLSRELQHDPHPKVRKWLHALNQASNLMTQTVHQMMNSSTMSDLKLVYSKVSLPTLAQHARDIYQRIAGGKNIGIILETAVEKGDVWTDVAAVSAVLDNLLSNAVKYTAPGGRVSIRILSESGHLVCAVCDDGPGLSAEDQAKLFQKGVRLSAVPTGGEPSTGYGLAVAKALMDQLGGEIWCMSQFGEGSCFYFRLPLYDEQKHNVPHMKTDPERPAA